MKGLRERHLPGLMSVAFISCRGRLTKVLAGAARRGTGSKGGGGRVRISYVDTRELAGFQNKLICHFILAADMVEGGIWEFVNNTDRSAFLERDWVWMGISRSEFTTVQVERCPFTRFDSI